MFGSAIVMYICLMFCFSAWQDPEHRGKGNTDGSPYFRCNQDDGVFVSMDKIVKAVDVSIATKMSDNSKQQNSSSGSDKQFQQDPQSEKILTQAKSNDGPSLVHNIRSKTIVVQEKGCSMVQQRLQCSLWW